jgi:hypothetical protein
MMTNHPFEELPAKLAEVATLHPDTVAHAEEHATNFEVFRKPKRKYTRRTKAPAVIKEVSVTLADEVLATAREIAGGDMRRVQFLEDGSAIVHNHPYRPIKPQENR